jgi:predicted nucleic acid-binding protein
LTAVVIDASVAMKWFVPEPLSPEAARLLDGSFDLVAPDLLLPEFGNTLWKKLVRREIVSREASEILTALARVPFTIIRSGELLDAALEIALATRRTVYDALYVAAAVRRDCTLLTADDRLVRSLASSPLAGFVRSLAGSA